MDLAHTSMIRMGTCQAQGRGSSLRFHHIRLLRRFGFFFDSLAGSICSDWGRCSIDSLLLSPEPEVCMKREKLTMLARLWRRWSTSPFEQSEVERSLSRRDPGKAKTVCSALVMVEREEESEGTSVETRGPGSPRCGEASAW